MTLNNMLYKSGKFPKATFFQSIMEVLKLKNFVRKIENKSVVRK